MSTGIRQNETSANCDSPAKLTLVDRFARVHRSLRVSVTDACNIRCQYCMPEEGAEFLPASNLLSFDEIETFVRAVVPAGITNIRLTGGEPLLRRNLHELVARLNAIDGVDDLAMTTNGMLLAEHLPNLVSAGLRRINVSLDTLSESVFKRISRRSGIAKTIEGINAALDHRDVEVKLNALVLRDVNLDGVLDLVSFAVERKIVLRFIEFMPLDADRKWNDGRMVSGEELRTLISSRFGPLQAVPSEDPSRPSRDYVIKGSANEPSKTRLGFIDSVSKPFCASCDRLRLTADGKIRNCLFSQEEWDVAQYLRSSSCDGEPSTNGLLARLQESVQAKHASHGIADPTFKPPQRAMYQIGG